MWTEQQCPHYAHMGDPCSSSPWRHGVDPIPACILYPASGSTQIRHQLGSDLQVRLTPPCIYSSDHVPLACFPVVSIFSLFRNCSPQSIACSLNRSIFVTA